MEVDFKDRDESTEYFNIALKVAGVSLDYVHVDMIVRIKNLVEKKKGNCTIDDVVKAKSEWQKHWDNYKKLK